FSSPSYTLWDPPGGWSAFPGTAQKGPDLTHAATSCTPHKEVPREFTSDAHTANLRAFTNTYDGHYDFGNGTSSAKLALGALLGANAEKKLAAGECPSSGAWLTVSYPTDSHGSTIANSAAGGTGKIPVAQRECVWKHMLQ